MRAETRQKNAGKLLTFQPFFDGRGSRIRTCGPLLPKQVLYQAELCPDTCSINGLFRLWSTLFYMFRGKFYMLREVDALFSARRQSFSLLARPRQCGNNFTPGPEALLACE